MDSFMPVASDLLRTMTRSAADEGRRFDMKQQTKRIKEVARLVDKHPNNPVFYDMLRTLLAGGSEERSPAGGERWRQEGGPAGGLGRMARAGEAAMGPARDGGAPARHVLGLGGGGDGLAVLRGPPDGGAVARSAQGVRRGERVEGEINRWSGRAAGEGFTASGGDGVRRGEPGAVTAEGSDCGDE